ncbi:MAG: hypothetical protein GY805_20105 [Chloroflexi bacterium]|nr:hypothetical protein [Chloroflexota bacterium]
MFQKIAKIVSLIVTLASLIACEAVGKSDGQYDLTATAVSDPTITPLLTATIEVTAVSPLTTLSPTTTLSPVPSIEPATPTVTAVHATSISDIAPEPTLTSLSPPTVQSNESMSMSTISPDGQWRIAIHVSDSVSPEEGEAEQFPNGKYHVELIAERTDGSQSWTAVNEWRGDGLGATYPKLVRWSIDGRFLYFANVSTPDGCSLLVNGGDLWRLDLGSGAMTEIAPYIGLVMAMSPDETELAVNASYGRGFLIRNLETGEEQSISLPELDERWAISGLQWSPNGQHLLLMQTINPCGLEMKTAVIRIDIETLTATTILELDEREFTLLEWVGNEEVKLQDKIEQIWYLEMFSGELAPFAGDE